MDGRNLYRVARLPRSLLVSILARPHGRAQLSCNALNAARISSFQSSPALMDGRNMCGGNKRLEFVRVSILARPHGRAQREAGSGVRRVVYRFQSSPALMDGRNKGLTGGLTDVSEFQSSPALMDGRNLGRVHQRVASPSVSILARPHGRAQQPVW